MLILPQEEYALVVSLVEASGMRGHLALVYEVLNGRQTGVVWVDRRAAPRSALVCNQTGFYFAFGEPDEAQVRPVLEQFLRQERWEYATSLFASSPSWESLLDLLLLPAGCPIESRLAFELVDPQPEAEIPPGFSLVDIQEDIARSIVDGTGTGGFGIDPWFIKIAGGASGYASLGLGKALVIGGQVASISGVCGLAHGEVELEVGTMPSFRGRGLAVTVTQAFMRQCQSRGLLPAYSCGSRNAPSISVAHKLGFREIEEIRGYSLSAKRLKRSRQEG